MSTSTIRTSSSLRTISGCLWTGQICQCLFAAGLNARGVAGGVRAFSVHPDVVTELMHAMSEDERAAAIARSGSLSPFETAEQGAATSLWCATGRHSTARAVSIAKTSTSRSPLQRAVRRHADYEYRSQTTWRRSRRFRFERSGQGRPLGPRLAQVQARRSRSRTRHSCAVRRRCR